METATRTQRDPMGADEPSPPSTARRVLDAAAGPALIVASVLIALRGIAFLPNLSARSPRAGDPGGAGPHLGVGVDRVAGPRFPAEPVGPAPRHPVLLAPPLVHAWTGDRRRSRAAVEPLRDVRELVRRGPAERVALAAHDGFVVAVRMRRRAPGADRPESDPGRPGAVLVPAEGGARADRLQCRRALARDGGLGLDPGDQPPVRRHARVDAVPVDGGVRVLRPNRVAAPRVARARR